MGKRSRRKQGRARPPSSTTDYVDADRNVLTVRDHLSPGTLSKLREPVPGAATTADDAWRRRSEMLFERLVTRWVIAGLPLERQDELLARYRIAGQATQSWVRTTLEAHLENLAGRAADRT